MPPGTPEQLNRPSRAEILALHSYDGVTYIGGDDGLWGLAEPRYPGSVGALGYAQVTERPVLDVATTFGVGAVAHGDGLSVLALGSSWLADEYFRPSEDELDAPAQAVTWTHHDILSRTAPLVHEVVPATFELRTLDHEKHYVFQGLSDGPPRELLDGGDPISAIAPRSYATWQTASDTATLYRKKRYGWRMERPADELELEPRVDFRLVGSVQGRVISLREFGSYLLCELSDRLCAVDEDGVETVLLDHPATDIRVYPKSRRYRGIVTAVSEAGVHVFELE
jgi:hypothetical protein